MARTIPTTATLPSLAGFGAGEDITLAEWENLAELQNYLYARQGCLCPGRVFEEPWETTSTSYVTANSATVPHYDLDDWLGVFRFQRIMNDPGNGPSYSARFVVYAKNLDVLCTFARLDTADGLTTSLSTFASSTSHSSSDSEWQTHDFVRTEAEASRSGSSVNGLAYHLVYIQAKVPTTGTGYLWTWGVRESPLAVNQLPIE